MPKTMPNAVDLDAGRCVRFSLAKRPGNPIWFAHFTGPDGSRLQRNTGETSKPRSVTAGARIVREVYTATAASRLVTWDEACEALEAALVANNNKPGTISDYLGTVAQLRNVFPTTTGPTDITVQLAKQFKTIYSTTSYTRAKPKALKVWKGIGRKPINRPNTIKSYTRSPASVGSRLVKLGVIWSRWFIQELGYLTVNPWDEVAPPRQDKPTPRRLDTAEVDRFLSWLNKHWGGWKTPVLFVQVAGLLGNRISELCSLKSAQLVQGRVVFAADETKGRRERRMILPPDVYAELTTLAGPTFVWERFPAQLAQRIRMAGNPDHRVNPTFHPRRLKWWLQREINRYFASHPEAKSFSCHDLRRRAMTCAWEANIHPERAAVTFGCNVRTMMKHYVACDATAVSDEVLGLVQERLRVG